MEKKTDRRALYTQTVVKDALLALLTQKPFDKISVTDLCKEAEISRATFYLHFNNVDDMLDQVIDEAIAFSEKDSCTLSELLHAISESDSIEDVMREGALLPPCQRIADSERYRPLFLDPAVSDHTIRCIAQRERSAMVSDLVKHSGATEEEAELIFRFILHGTFGVIRTLGWQKDERWYRYQSLLTRFVGGGIREI